MGGEPEGIKGGSVDEPRSGGGNDGGDWGGGKRIQAVGAGGGRGYKATRSLATSSRSLSQRHGRT